MLVGAVPALLTVFIRMLVPESEKWQKEKEAGRASHWSERDLLGDRVSRIYPTREGHLYLYVELPKFCVAYVPSRT